MVRFIRAHAPCCSRIHRGKVDLEALRGKVDLEALRFVGAPCSLRSFSPAASARARASSHKRRTAGEEANRMASYLELSAPPPPFVGGVTSLPSCVTWWRPTAGPAKWRALPSVVTWAPPTTARAEGAHVMSTPPKAGGSGRARWFGGVMVSIWGQKLGEDSEVDALEAPPRSAVATPSLRRGVLNYIGLRWSLH